MCENVPSVYSHSLTPFTSTLHIPISPHSLHPLILGVPKDGSYITGKPPIGTLLFIAPSHLNFLPNLNSALHNFKSFHPGAEKVAPEENTVTVERGLHSAHHNHGVHFKLQLAHVYSQLYGEVIRHIGNSVSSAKVTNGDAILKEVSLLFGSNKRDIRVFRVMRFTTVIRIIKVCFSPFLVF